MKSISVPDKLICDVLDTLNQNDIKYGVQDISQFIVNGKVLNFCVEVRESDVPYVSELINTMVENVDNTVSL